MLNKSLCTTTRHIAALFAAMTLTASAHAGLIGVKSIEVSSAINDWLQVAEVIALNGANADVALATFGAIASAPDSWQNRLTPDKAIDGSTAGSARLNQIFHEGSPLTGDTLTITLPSVQELMSLAVYGRTDCCSARDIYDVVLKDINGNILQTVSNLDATGASHVGSITFAANSVPEPGSMLLVGAALVGLGAASRRKR